LWSAVAAVISFKLICVCIFIAGATFAYDGQKALFVDLDFGIDMASRSESSWLVNDYN